MKSHECRLSLEAEGDPDLYVKHGIQLGFHPEEHPSDNQTKINSP
jgi:hypothetical protein